MTRIMLTAFAFFMFASLVFAQDGNNAKTEAERTIYIRTFCDIVAGTHNYKMPEDPVQSGDYEQEGENVPSADLMQPIKPLQYPIDVPVEIDFIEFADIPLNETIQDAADLEGNIVEMKIYENGRVEYNGQDLTDSAVKYCITDAVEEGELQKAGDEGAANIVTQKKTEKSGLINRRSEDEILKGNTDAVINRKSRDEILKGRQVDIGVSAQKSASGSFKGPKSDIQDVLDKLSQNNPAEQSKTNQKGAGQGAGEVLPSGSNPDSEDVLLEGQYP